MKLKPIPPVEKKDGRIILNFDCTEASANWLRYGRLKKLADEGDEEARKECERVDKATMLTINKIKSSINETHSKTNQ